MEQGIILNGRERQFEQLPNEERHLTATATSLRFQMRHARHRHIVGEVEGAVPGLVAKEAAGTEPEGAEFPTVFVNLFCAAQEQLTTRKESAVVIEIMNVDLESAAPHLLQESLWNRIPVLWHDLKRRPDARRLVEIHELRAEIPAG